jgi:D-arginine dehydrogenase
MFDHLVIGGGMAGAAVAYMLAPSGSVALLEREAQFGHHSTGRSAALFIEGYGNAAIRALNRASRPFFDAPPDGFAATPLLTPRGVLMIAREDQLARLDAAEAELSAQALVRPERLDAEGCRRLVPMLRPGHIVAGMLDPGATDIDVDALHQGFLRGARSKGATVTADAEIRAIERTAAGWRVESTAGTFEAATLVNAAGAWADVIAAMAGVRPLGLQPKRRTAALVDPPPGMDIRRWPGLIDVDEQFYCKPDAGLLLVSPADETPSEPIDAQPDELDIAIGIDRLQQAADLPVRRVVRSWAGLRSFFADRTPAVGPAADAPGFFWLAGQGGYGIQTAPAMGALAASLITGRPLPDTLAAAGVEPALLSPSRPALAAKD